MKEVHIFIDLFDKPFSNYDGIFEILKNKNKKILIFSPKSREYIVNIEHSNKKFFRFFFYKTLIKEITNFKIQNNLNTNDLKKYLYIDEDKSEVSSVSDDDMYSNMSIKEMKTELAKIKRKIICVTPEHISMAMRLFDLIGVPYIISKGEAESVCAKLSILNNKATVELMEDEYGISPGQACVFYSKDNIGDKVLGGGWIHRTYNKNLSTKLTS